MRALVSGSIPQPLSRTPEVGVGAGGETAGAPRPRLELGRCQADLDAADAVGQRVPGVGAEIDEHLLDLGRVRQDQQRFLAEHQLERGTGRQGRAQQRRGFADQRRERPDREMLRLASAEGKDLLHQAARTGRRLLDLFEVVGRRMRRLEFLARQRDVAEDRGQDVVEVVGDAARQGADGLQLLRFAQLRLQREAVRLGLPAGADVAEEGGEFVSGIDLQDRDRELDGERVAVAMLRVDLDQPIEHPAAAARREARESAPVRLPKAGRDDRLLQQPADRLRSAPAEQRLRPGVPAGDPARRVHLDDRVERVLDDREIAVATLVEGGFGLRPLFVGAVAHIEHVVELAGDIADLARPARCRASLVVAARHPNRGLREILDRMDHRARHTPGEQQRQRQRAEADRGAAQLQCPLFGEHVGLEHADEDQPVRLRHRRVGVEASDPVDALDGARPLAARARTGERLRRCRPPGPLLEVARAHRGAALRIEGGHDSIARQRSEHPPLQLLKVGGDKDQTCGDTVGVDDRMGEHRDPAPALPTHVGAADPQPGALQSLPEPGVGRDFGRARRVRGRGTDRPGIEVAHAERAEFRLQQDVLADQRIAALRVQSPDQWPRGQIAQRVLALLQREVQTAGRIHRHLLDARAGLLADLLTICREQPREHRTAGHDDDRDQQKQLPPDGPAAHRCEHQGVI
jgi:hypothetical protein